MFRVERAETAVECTVCAIVQFAKIAPETAVVGAIVLGVKIGKSENVALRMCGSCEQHMSQAVSTANAMPATEDT